MCDRARHVRLNISVGNVTQAARMVMKSGQSGHDGPCCNQIWGTSTSSATEY